MKNFKEICMMTKEEVKTYMHKYLASRKYDVINKNGFIYAKGDIPVLLVAHMDTVHDNQCVDIIDENGKLSSPQGIGGDDRCGIFIIMNIVKELRCSILLCEDEEKGLVGARKFAESKYVNELGVNYIVEVDRKGSNDAVFYQCDNKEFTDFITDVTGFKKNFGSCSDISAVAPAAKIAAVNLSCGYYNAHTLKEYVVYEEMMDTVEVIKNLVKTEVDGPFEYIRQTFGHYNCHAGGYFDEPFERDCFDSYLIESPYRDMKMYNDVKHDQNIELEVVYMGWEPDEQVAYGKGKTKVEAWFNFFLDNPNVCFNDVVAYSYC